MPMFGRRVVRRHSEVQDENSLFGNKTYLAHHGIKGQVWGIRNGPPYPLERPETDISYESYTKVNDLYRSMPLADRRMIDPDISDEPEDYFSSYTHYRNSTAFNAVSDHGFIIAEKIPKNSNVGGTRGVEIGVGVTDKGQGIGTGLTKDLVDWFDDQDEYDVMWWPVDERNKGSIRIAEKNGFVKDPLGDNYVYAKDSAFRNLRIKTYNTLKSYDKQTLSKESISKFKSQAPQLAHVRVNKNTTGELYLKDSKLAGMINTEKKNDGTTWIQGIEVFGDNQGKGLGYAMLDHAVQDLGATNLSVNKKNTRAKMIYDKYGFETYEEDDTMYYMKY